MALQTGVLVFSYNFSVFSKFSTINTFIRPFLRQLNVVEKMWKWVSGNFDVLNIVAILLFFFIWRKKFEQHFMHDPCQKRKLCFSRWLVENSSIYRLVRFPVWKLGTKKRNLPTLSNGGPWDSFPTFLLNLLILTGWSKLHGFKCQFTC